MRAPAVLLNVVVACAVGAAAGYSIANRVRMQEIARLRQERESGFARERELRAHLEEALAARAALAHETQRLQNELTERLRRLEEAASRLTTPAQPESGAED